METDRGAVLTLRAAARGVVDFSQARVLDVRWWRRSNALIKAMAAEDDLVAVRAAFDLQRSLVGNGNLTKESFEECQKKVQALFGDVIDVLCPWAAKDGEAKKTGQVNELIDKYRTMVGDPNDPEYAKKLAHDLALIDAQEEEGPEESETARIDRLLKERDERYHRFRTGGGMRP